MTWLPHCFRTQSKIVNMDSSPRPSLQPPPSPLWVPVTPVVHGNSHFLPQRDFAHNCFINVCSFIRLSPIRPKTILVLVIICPAHSSTQWIFFKWMKEYMVELGAGCHKGTSFLQVKAKMGQFWFTTSQVNHWNFSSYAPFVLGLVGW